MITTNYSIVLLSPGEDNDHITAYSYYGNLQWEVNVISKIMSWKLKDGRLYVFSKSRYTDNTYLICIDPTNGKILWERP